MKKKYGTFVADGYQKNSIFDLAHELNRDDCSYPFHLTKSKFGQFGYELNTEDIIKESQAAFSLHMNVHVRRSIKPSYVLMLEAPQIFPRNDQSLSWRQYRKVFTWNDNVVDGQNFIKINFPNPITIPEVDGFKQRDRFCCIIAGNKASAVRDSRELYSERVRAIRWFEQYAPQDFDLYGTRWDIPAVRTGFFDKLEKRFWRYAPHFMRPQPFPSYRGKVDRKRDVLGRTRFSICYENVRDLPGYITEKIFDCFFSGCVPVYWGANNVADYIPTDCYIDRRQFDDTSAVYAHLKEMDEDTYRGYQQRIANFLESDHAYPFSAEAFAETIVETIVRDLEAQK